MSHVVLNRGISDFLLIDSRANSCQNNVYFFKLINNFEMKNKQKMPKFVIKLYETNIYDLNHLNIKII